MEYSKRFSGNDELRMRFTVWLKIVVKRVKIDYIRRQKKRYIEVSIEEAAITNTLKSFVKETGKELFTLLNRFIH